MELTAVVVDRTANRLGVDEEELLQEAYILLTDPAKPLAHLAREGEWSLLAYRLDQKLSNVVNRQVRNADRHESYEERYDEDYTPAALCQRAVSAGYDRDLVESLLPSLWDDAFCFGIRAENAPDPDMPRGSTNKATGNTLAAHVADTQRAWALSGLSKNEKRALLLTHGLGWTQDEIAKELGVNQSTVSRYLYSGVGRMVAMLNGDEALLEQIEEAA